MQEVSVRPCRIMLKILPISLVSKSHALHLNFYQLVFNSYPLVSIKIINENYTATSQMLLYNLLRNYIGEEILEKSQLI